MFGEINENINRWFWRVWNKGCGDVVEELGFDLGNVSIEPRNRTYDELFLEEVLKKYARKALRGKYTSEMKVKILNKMRKAKGEVWKNGWHMLYLPMYEEILKEYRYIHIIRDGRDIVTSSTHTGFPMVMIGQSWMMRDYAKLWNRVNVNAHVTAEELLPDRYHLIRFEDLCFNSEHELLRLLDFLKFNHSHLPKLLKIIKPPKTFGRWKKADDRTIGIINDILDPGLRYFNYR